MPAYYRASFRNFLRSDRDSIFAALNRRAAEENLGPQYQEQVQVWDEQLPVLHRAIRSIVDQEVAADRWTVLLEFPIPRMRRRIDCVVLGPGVVIVIEFKRHQHPTAEDRRQVEEYCLDLRDFHEASADLPIRPVLVTGQTGPARTLFSASTELKIDPMCVGAKDLAAAILGICNEVRGLPIGGEVWDDAPYRPVPTIIEAAEMMFSGHGVREIGHAHAAAENLTKTSEHLVQTVLRARAESRHVMCFVTGVPGAGKTLTGLNVVHDPRLGGLGAGQGEGA